MIERFFSLLWNAAGDEINRLRWMLISIVAATLVGVLPILAFRPSVGECFWITLVPWVFSMYRLFSIRRFIRLHVTGEVVEVVGALFESHTPATGTGIFDNYFIRTYLSIISGILLVQTALFLIMPLYVNHTAGGFTTGIVIAMLAVAIAIISVEFFAAMFRVVVIGTLSVYFVGLIFVLVPQITLYARGAIGPSKIVPVSTAKLINKYDDLQKKQREKAENDYLEYLIRWQQDNPGKKLSEKAQKWFDNKKKLT